LQLRRYFEAVPTQVANFRSAYTYIYNIYRYLTPTLIKLAVLALDVIVTSAVGGDAVLVVLLVTCDGSGFLHVGAAEEMSEQHEVGRVHDQGDLNVLVAHVTLVTGFFDLVGPDVDNSAHYHLRQLGSRDEHRNIARHTELESLESVVTVHDAVYDVVHKHEPACCGDVVGV